MESFKFSDLLYYFKKIVVKSVVMVFLLIGRAIVAIFAILFLIFALAFGLFDTIAKTLKHCANLLVTIVEGTEDFLDELEWGRK